VGLLTASVGGNITASDELSRGNLPRKGRVPPRIRRDAGAFEEHSVFGTQADEVGNLKEVGEALRSRPQVRLDTLRRHDTAARLLFRERDAEPGWKVREGAGESPTVELVDLGGEKARRASASSGV
jgi:hypothetical protein